MPKKQIISVQSMKAKFYCLLFVSFSVSGSSSFAAGEDVLSQGQQVLEALQTPAGAALSAMAFILGIFVSYRLFRHVMRS